ncbi:MAG: peptide chain release factor N(5)-glutamine methyltransferase [Leptolyngbya sp. SIO1D8]|nr:peptide chain release factor N(5)-glutamine methyltransferase [Leptolyngbya sp. SIO1D8]
MFLDTISGQELWDWRQRAMVQATGAQVDAVEVDWLLQGLCQVDSLSLRLGTLANQSHISTKCSLKHLERLWQQRVEDRVPIQHLVGQTSWRNFRLQVSASVLIPRPETELMIDLVRVAVNQSSDCDRLRRGTWVDLGTGSGAIALSLAETLPEANIIAVDISTEALAIAQQNAVENGLGDRIQFLQGSWFEPLENSQGQLAGVVSNPPYIPSAIVPTLQPEVANHEPHLALDGGEDGLACVRHLIEAGSQFLQPGGGWFVELMLGQAPAVMELLAQTGCYEAIQTHQDLAGVGRFVSAQKP